MVFNNVKLAGSNNTINIGISHTKIAYVSPYPVDDMAEKLQLQFDNAIVFPGLINSHDHLDFNLFPQLGHKTYSNYTEWGNYIHKNYKNEIADVVNIPLSLRVSWGLYKNLLCGVTTVVNHGEYLVPEEELITVFQECECLHSVQFEKNWRRKLNTPTYANLPVAIHVGEGNDTLSHKEIDQLTRWNLLGKKLVGIHAVAMSEKQAKKFDAIVWCPRSNYFLLNKTADIDLLKKYTTILFGTDSTLTSTWDIWEQLQLARKTGHISDDELYRTTNKNAANTWKLNSGDIAAGKVADIVIAKSNADSKGFDGFFELGPADLLLVIHNGNIRLFDESLLPQLSAKNIGGFSKVYVKGVCKYIVGDLPGLIKKIREYRPETNFPVSVENPA